jgi:ribosome modulation factor
MRSARLDRIRRYYRRGYHNGYIAGLKRAGASKATIKMLLEEQK